MSNTSNCAHKRFSPTSRYLAGAIFYLRSFWKFAWLTESLSTIEPFAYVSCDNICHEGMEECYKFRHLCSHPFAKASGV